MRADWNMKLHECFPDYVRAKERGWQPEESPEKSAENAVPTLVKQEPELAASIAESIMQPLLKLE